MKKYTVALICIIPAVLLFLFYQFHYWGMLHYSEQYQIFLFTKKFLSDHLWYPGGIMDYLGQFLTQFFIFRSWGSIIMAICFGLGTYLVHLFTKSTNANYNKDLQALVLVPMAATWAFMVTNYANLSFALSMIVSIAFAVLYTRINNKYSNIILLPLVYWATCYGVFVYAALCLIWHIGKKHSNLSALTLLTALYVAVILLTTYHFNSLRFHSLCFGWHFNKNPIEHLNSEFFAMIVTVATPAALLFINKVQYKWIINAVIVAASVGYIYKMQMPLMNQMYKLNYHAQNEQWKSILKYDEEKLIRHDLTLATRNLALAKTNRLLDEMFDIEQSDYQCLLPDWHYDFVTPVFLGEIMYNLSNVSLAQRYFSECNNAISDYQKSAKCYVRMTECSMLNREEKLTRKNARILQNTLFYKNFADSILYMCDNTNEIMKNKKYSQMINNGYKIDALYFKTEPEQMLKIQLLGSPRNYVAVQYLLALNLIRKDLDALMQNMQYLKPFNPNSTPRYVAQALTIVWYESKNKNINIPEIYKREITEFMQFAQNNSFSEVTDRYKNSYYFHYYCKDYKNEISAEN
ncbi:MAG: DUF6057 family protein [Salinivirgaceae bacterium]|nr:DUF6057 family protein [Salinivirgaceae bacterium]